MNSKIIMMVPAFAIASSNAAWADGGNITRTGAGYFLILIGSLAVVAVGSSLFMRRMVRIRTEEMKGLVKLLESQLVEANRKIEEGYQAELNFHQLQLISAHIEEMVNEIIVQLGMIEQIIAHHYRISTDIGETMKGNQLDEERFNSVVEHMESSKSVMRNNLKRAIKSLEDFKYVSDSVFSNEKQRVNLREFIENTVSLMQYKLSRMDCSVELDLSDQTAEILPGGLSVSILQMLITSMAYGSGGKIRISTGFDKERFFMVYHDDRALISNEDFDRVVERAKNLEKETDPLRLDFQMMYNLVVNNLGGRLKFESHAENGTNLSILLALSDGDEM